MANNDVAWIHKANNLVAMALQRDPRMCIRAERPEPEPTMTDPLSTYRSVRDRIPDGGVVLCHGTSILHRLVLLRSWLRQWRQGVPMRDWTTITHCGLSVWWHGEIFLVQQNVLNTLSGFGQCEAVRLSEFVRTFKGRVEVRALQYWQTQDKSYPYTPAYWKVVEFATKQVGRPYSLCAVIRAFVKGKPNNELGYCSGLVRRSLMAMGWQGGGIADLPCDVEKYSCVSKEGTVLK
jgi:hypothetical protein